MKRSIPMLTAAMALLLLTFTQTASASWYFDIESSATNVYDLVLYTDEEIEFYGGSFSFLYGNDDTLTWKYASDLTGWLSWCDTGETVEASDSDIILTLLPDDFSYLTVTASTVLATFTFTGEGTADLSFDLEDPNMLVGIDGGMYDIAGNPVPVPAAVWLLGSGLLGLVGLRRKQS